MGERMPIEGTHNFRDVGGYPAGGRRTRTGQVFRSDALSALTPAGLADLARLGIAVFVDLRTKMEVAQDTSTPALPDALRVHIPIHGGSQRSIIQDGHISLEKLYLHVLEDSAWSLGAAVSVIAESAERPVLVACTAGKDRTGLVIALALAAAGVETEAVVADYMQSALNLDGDWMDQTVSFMVSKGVPITPALFEVIGGSPDQAMANLLELLEQRHGSISGYLLAHGVREESLGLLREKLLGPDLQQPVAARAANDPRMEGWHGVGRRS
jgi:protein-tyrosine phosphatase